MISSQPQTRHRYRDGFEATCQYSEAVFTLGAALQAGLIAWGLFGQNALVLLARAMQVDSRLLTIPARMATAAIAVALIGALFLRPSRIVVGWPMLAFLAFWTAYSIRLFIMFGSDIGLPLEMGRFNYTFIAQMAIGGCFLPALALLSGTCWDHHKRALWASIFLCILAAIAMFNLYGESMIHFERRISSNAMIGDTAAVHPLALGYTGSVMSVLGIYLLFCLKSKVVARGIFAFSLLGVGIALLVGSASRGPVVAVAVSALVLLASLGRRFAVGRLISFAALIGLSAVAIGWYAETTGSTLLSRLFGIANAIEAEEQSAGRIDLYAAAISQILQSPVFGSQSTFQYEGDFGYTHNLILGSLMATGLVGTIPLVVLLVFAVRAAFFVLMKAPEQGWIPMLFMLYLTGGMFSWALYTNVELWLTMASTLSMAAWIRQQERADADAIFENL